MPTPSAMKTGRRKGILVAEMPFNDPRFTRADLIFSGVDHSGSSYEVLVFLNNRSATDKTEHDVKRGYGGRFVIFGHGGCYGDLGHCEIPQSRAVDDLRPPHPLTPATTIVTITDALQYLLMNSESGLETVTLIPVEITPRRKDRAISPTVFRFDDVTLRTYLVGTDLDLSMDADHLLALRPVAKP